MAGKKANPLCQTCGVHEAYSMKVNFMWAAGWVVFVLCLPGVGWFANDVYAKIKDNRVAISDCTKASIERDQDISVKFLNDISRLERNDNETERAIQNVAINLRHLMETVGVKYIEPTKIHLGQATR